MTDQDILKIADSLKNRITAAAILREAARLAGENRKVLPGDLMHATENYLAVLAEMKKKGL